jgi:hypothetical protein
MMNKNHIDANVLKCAADTLRQQMAVFESNAVPRHVLASLDREDAIALIKALDGMAEDIVKEANESPRS